MKKQIIFSAIIGGVIGSIVIILLLVLVNQGLPLQTKDLLSFVLSTVAIVIAAFTVLGAVTLFTAWNDIDERSEKIVTKYEERAKQSMDKYGTEVKQEIVKDVNERQVQLADITQQYGNELVQRGEKAQRRLRNTFLLSIAAIVLVAIGTYIRNRFGPWKKQ